MHQNLRPAALVRAAGSVNTMQRGLNSECNALLHLYLPRSMAIAETQSGRTNTQVAAGLVAKQQAAVRAKGNSAGNALICCGFS
jgi:hypothetical protein